MLQIPFQRPVLTQAQAHTALDAAVRQVRTNLPVFAGRFQDHSSRRGTYRSCGNTHWTSGFWPGQLWLCYQYTGESIFRQTGLSLASSMHRRVLTGRCLDHHDLGFLYTPSCVACWELTKTPAARQAALLAANRLMLRFRPKGEFFQAWGPVGAPGCNRFIIDSLMNLPLLHWASRQTGKSLYANAAVKHSNTCYSYILRPDGSTFHTFFMQRNGRPKGGRTCQGYSDSSFWARGQAWAIYGSLLDYRETGNQRALDVFWQALRFYLNHLPADLVPYWDLIFGPESSQPRDSSAAAIVSCALLQAASVLDLPSLAILARQILYNLCLNYAPARQTPGGGLLLHGTYSKKSRYNTCLPMGIDEFTTWGDYFYLEALSLLVHGNGGFW